MPTASPLPTSRSATISHPQSSPIHDPSFPHALYDTGMQQLSFSPVMPSSSLFNVLAYTHLSQQQQHQNTNSWHAPPPNLLHLFPARPYPSPQPSHQVPRPIAHIVWILDCISCGTFFTNRGMKVSINLDFDCHAHLLELTSPPRPFCCSGPVSRFIRPMRCL